MNEVIINIRRYFKTMIFYLSYVFKIKKIDSIIIHKKELSVLPEKLALHISENLYKDKLNLDSELTLLLTHNYKYPTLFEKSLMYHGISNYIVLNPEKENKNWHNSIKIKLIYDYLINYGIHTKYIMYCDSTDAVLINDINKSIELLNKSQGKLLVSSSEYIGGYELMPEIKKWTDEMSLKKGFKKAYINAGVFISESGFLNEYLSEAMKYVSDNDLTLIEYRKLLKENKLKESIGNFKKGIGCDQLIMRYLHPKFFPEIQIDYKKQLALR